jgi:polysaccharide export outer membrane protein
VNLFDKVAVRNCRAMKNRNRYMILMHCFCLATLHRCKRFAGRRLVGAVLLLLLWPAAGAYAQAIDASGGTLGSLLGQLQGLEQSGALQGFLEGKVPSKVDQTRKSNQEKLQAIDVDPATAKIFDKTQTEGLTQIQWHAVKEYCEGRLSDGAESPFLPSRHLFTLLERDYCLRAGEAILQYGYDLIGSDPEVAKLSVGRVSDSYVLGVEDELVLTFHGQVGQSIAVPVDREGRLNIPDWPPIPAAGRTLGDVRREIEVRTATTKLGTDVFVSLGAIRAVSVLVLGEVEKPGQHQLTALSNILDAVGKAGGIKKTGSLRRLQLQRNDQVHWIDAYDLLYTGVIANDLSLHDGDRIIVPTLGPTFALVGDVRRPGIYELPEGRRSISLAEGLQFAGGTIRPRGNRFVQITVDQTGGEQITEHTNLAGKIGDGDVLRVVRGRNIQLGGVFLEGHVRVQGRRSLASAGTVADLLGDPSALKPNPYLPFAVLETTDPATYARRFFPLNLQNIIEGRENYALRDGDRLVVLSAEDVRYLVTSDVQTIITRHLEDVEGRESASEKKPTDETQKQDTENPLTAVRGLLDATQATREEESSAVVATSQERARQLDIEVRIRSCGGLASLVRVLADRSVERYASAIIGLQEAADLRHLSRRPCPQVFEEHPDVLPILLEHVVAVTGAVREPGLFPVVGEVPVTTLVVLAGGFARNVDLTRVEVSRYIGDALTGTSRTNRGLVNIAEGGGEKTVVAAGDVVRFNAVFTDRDTGTVLLAGEFVRPGRYEIRRGERLSSVIARAGGLTRQAYPYGAIFSRESVKRAQQSGLRRAARELNSALAVAAVQRGISPTAILGLQRFAQQLGDVESIGRVVIEADPTVLQVRPELDSVLEPGDRVFMPKRPNFVTVIGDVLNPGALQFIASTPADVYIRQAGGFQRSADEDRVFVVYPNGVAEPLAVSVWNFNPVQVPPGSTIVVPKDPAPLDLLTMVREGSQLLGQLAVTAASLAVISRN